MEIKEEWKDIEGYEGLYQISNYGRVKSLKRECWNGKAWFTKKEKILKCIIRKDGYARVCLCKDGKTKDVLVHRLVAIAFIPNPNNLPQVNHKDENKEKNHVSNLEWCDSSYNANYGTRVERATKNKPNMKGENNPMYGKIGELAPTSKKIVQLTLEGEFVKIWESIRQASLELGLNKSSIGKCCIGIRLKKTGGFKWMYYEDYIQLKGEIDNENI